MRQQTVRSSLSAGFTLVELLVAVSIFVILVGALGGIYVQFAHIQRAQRAQEALQQNVQTFFEMLDREVRTGYGMSFKAESQSFALINQNSECVNYTLASLGPDDGRIVRTVSNAAPSGCNPGGGGGTPITTNQTEIQSITFQFVKKPDVDENGTPGDPSDDLLTGSQGRVTVFVQACPPSGVSSPCVDLQTTLTSRQHGVPPNN